MTFRIDKLGVVIAALLAYGAFLVPFASFRANRIVPGEGRLILAEQDQDRLEEELDERQHAQPDQRPPEPPDGRDDDHGERQPAEQVAEVPVGLEPIGPVEHAETGEEHLDDDAGGEQPGDDGQGGICTTPSAHW